MQFEAVFASAKAFVLESSPVVQGLLAVGLILGLIGLFISWWVINTAFLRPWYYHRFFASQGIKSAKFIPFLGAFKAHKQVETAHRDVAVEHGSHYTTGYLVAPYYEDIMKTCGSPNFVYQLGMATRFNAHDLDLVRDVLSMQHKHYMKTNFIKPSLVDLLGDGLLLSEGLVHKRHRAIITPKFSNDSLKVMSSGITKCAHTGLADWRKLVRETKERETVDGADGARFDIHPHISALTLAIIGTAAFGRPMGDGEASAVLDDVTEILNRLSKLAGQGWGLIPSFHRLPLPQMRAVMGNVERMRAVAGSLVQARAAERKAGRQASGEDDLDCEDRDLLDILLDAKEKYDAGEVDRKGNRTGFTDSECIDEAVMFVLAGHETTSQTMCWSLFLLAQHPEWIDRVRQEVRDLLVARGADPKEAPPADFPTFEELRQMKWLDAVACEALRLFPAAPVLARKAIDTHKIGREGRVTIPAGCEITIPVHFIHRDPEIWRDPDSFDPSRWVKREHGGREEEEPFNRPNPNPKATAKELVTGRQCRFVNPKGDHISPAAGEPCKFTKSEVAMRYLPFSAGPRGCIGRNFALMEVKVLLALFLHEFNFHLHGSYRHAPINIITMRPRSGMPFVISERAVADK